MEKAILRIEQQDLPLQMGAYLIRGRPAVRIQSSEYSRTIVLENDSVDDKHAIILAEEDELFIFDLDSRCGTFVNGERLAQLTKHKVSENVCIRFGEVDGKLRKCSTMEHHESSGFHDEFSNVVTDAPDNDAVFDTIPETQFIEPVNRIYINAGDDNKNISNITIPETQCSLDSENSPSIDVINMESDIRISTQEFNDVLNNTHDSNSRDFLDFFELGDRNESPTTLTTSSAIIATKVVSDEELRSQTHTPDLFDNEIFEEFEKREERLKSARAKRAQDESAITENQASISNAKDSTQKELDLFEDSISKINPQVGKIHTETPLESSNKENMRMDDFEPTQVFVSKKDMKPPVSISPENADSEQKTDFQPTQVFVPKKSKRKIANEKDLEATQKFIPKNLSKKTKQLLMPDSTPDAKDINLSSTVAQNDQNELDSVKRSQKFLTHLESDEPPSSSTKSPIHLSPSLSPSIMRTPEIISKMFKMDKPAETVSHGNILSSSIENSANEYALMQLLNNHRVESDFDCLVSALKSKESSNVQTDESEDILKNYMHTQTEKFQADQKAKMEKSGNSSSHNLRKRTISEVKENSMKRKKENETTSSQNERQNENQNQIRLRCRKTVDNTTVHSTEVLNQLEVKQVTKARVARNSTKELEPVKETKKQKINRKASISSCASTIIAAPSSFSSNSQKLSNTDSFSSICSSESVQKTSHSKSEESASLDKPLVASTGNEVYTRTTRARQRNSSVVCLETNAKANVEKQGKIISRPSSKSRTARNTLAATQTVPTLQIGEKPSTSQATNRGLKSDKGSNALKLAFTMVDPDKREELMKHANNKWTLVEDPTKCEVLVMDTGNRTLKFLIAVAKGIPIVTTKWLEAVISSGVIEARPDLFFKDTSFEKTFKFTLLHTLTEAKKAKIFMNFGFLFTNNITPTPTDMKVLITCAGGIIMDEESATKEKEKQQIYLISSENDRQHWRSYRRRNPNICITSTEAVMLAIMRYDSKILQRSCF